MNHYIAHTGSYKSTNRASAFAADDTLLNNTFISKLNNIDTHECRINIRDLRGFSCHPTTINSLPPRILQQQQQQEKEEDNPGGERALKYLDPFPASTAATFCVHEHSRTKHAQMDFSLVQWQYKVETSGSRAFRLKSVAIRRLDFARDMHGAPKNTGPSRTDGRHRK